VSLVVLLRGVNVGGHRRLRPTTLAAQLAHLGAVNIGAAGTFLIRKPIRRVELRAELARRIPFEAEIVICRGRDFANLLSTDAYADRPTRPDLVRFVSVLARRPREEPSLPLRLPATGEWLVKVLAREDRFVLGLYRRHMRTIGQLGALDRLFGVPATTRGWSTVEAVARVLDEGTT
jgi:uncharacterized protein (DUF1697 family)